MTKSIGDLIMLRGFFVKSNIKKANCNNQQSRDNHKSGSKIKIQRLIHIDSLSNFTAMSTQTIAKITSYVKVKNWINELIGQKLGVNKINPIQPAARLVKRADKTRSQEEFKNFFLGIYMTLT